jgi:hypothetical protein
MSAQVYFLPAAAALPPPPSAVPAACTAELARLLGASFPPCRLNDEDVLIFERLDDRQRLARLFHWFGLQLPRRADAEAYRIWSELVYMYGPAVKLAAWRLAGQSLRPAPVVPVRLDPVQAAYAVAVASGALHEARQRARHLLGGRGREHYLVAPAPLHLLVFPGA